MEFKIREVPFCWNKKFRVSRNGECANLSDNFTAIEWDLKLGLKFETLFEINTLATEVANSWNNQGVNSKLIGIWNLKNQGIGTCFELCMLDTEAALAMKVTNFIEI